MKTNCFAIAILAATLLFSLTQGARAFYNPQTGCWPSRDPSGEIGFTTIRPDVSNGTGDGADSYAFANNDPAKTIDLFGLESVAVTVITAIRPPDPQSGMKTTHYVVVDDHAKILTVLTNVGVTTIGNIQIHGTASFSQSATMADACIVSLSMSVEAHTRVFPAALSIRYNYQFDLKFCNHSGALTGGNETYPSYHAEVNGNQVYDYQQSGGLPGLNGKNPVNVNALFSW